VGWFGRPRGVSGDINITPATDHSGRFLDLTTVWTVIDGQRRELTLENVELVGGRPVAKIEGIDSREEAARLTNLTVEVPIDQALPLPEGSYYPFDLVGCRVSGSDGTEYGVIEEVLFYPANDLYRIRSARFGDVLFPAVDRFIVKIDIDRREVIIEPPPGLFDEGPDRPQDR